MRYQLAFGLFQSVCLIVSPSPPVHCALIDYRGFGEEPTVEGQIRYDRHMSVAPARRAYQYPEWVLLEVQKERGEISEEDAANLLALTNSTMDSLGCN